jgi:hypothetical protein
MITLIREVRRGWLQHQNLSGSHSDLLQIASTCAMQLFLYGVILRPRTACADIGRFRTVPGGFEARSDGHPAVEATAAAQDEETDTTAVRAAGSQYQLPQYQRHMDAPVLDRTSHVMKSGRSHVANRLRSLLRRKMVMVDESLPKRYGGSALSTEVGSVITSTVTGPARSGNDCAQAIRQHQDANQAYALQAMSVDLLDADADVSGGAEPVGACSCGQSISWVYGLAPGGLIMRDPISSGALP